MPNAIGKVIDVCLFSVAKVDNEINRIKYNMLNDLNIFSMKKKASKDSNKVNTSGKKVLLSDKVSGLNATYLLVFDSTHPLRILIKAGDTLRSIYATSGGKAVLSTVDDRTLANFLKSTKLTPLTKKTTKSAADLRKDIETGRKRGWFSNFEESLSGVTTISCVFRWNVSVYVVTIAGPSARLDQKIDAAALLLTDVCRRLETQTVAA